MRTSEATEGAIRGKVAARWTPAPDIRARILAVVKDLRQKSAVVSLEGVIAADDAERHAYEERYRHFPDEREWNEPRLANAQRELVAILPTLMDLTGFLVVPADIDGWISLDDITASPTVTDGHICCYAGEDAGRTVWISGTCGSPSSFIGLQRVIVNFPSDPQRRAQVSWISVCRDHAAAASEHEQVAAYAQSDDAKTREYRGVAPATQADEEYPQ